MSAIFISGLLGQINCRLRHVYNKSTTNPQQIAQVEFEYYRRLWLIDWLNSKTYERIWSNLLRLTELRRQTNRLDLGTLWTAYHAFWARLAKFWAICNSVADHHRTCPSPYMFPRRIWSFYVQRVGISIGGSPHCTRYCNQAASNLSTKLKGLSLNLHFSLTSVGTNFGVGDMSGEARPKVGRERGWGSWVGGSQPLPTS